MKMDTDYSDFNPQFLLEQNKDSCPLADHLSNIFYSDLWFDLSLICSDMTLKAHSCVLAAASDYFKHILRDLPPCDTYISVKDYSGTIVKKMLEFIYLGTTTIDSDSEVSFSNLLADFSVGGNGSVKMKDDKHVNQLTNGGDIPMDTLPPPENSNVAKKNKKYECGKCGLVVSDKTGLRMHMHTHKESKQFTCEICGKGFRQDSQRKTHLRTHTGEKPYKCEICNKSFAHGGTLKEHMNLHTGTKPFQCNVCLQSFAQRKALRAHRCEQEPSSSSKKFMCPHCNRAFDTRRGLAVHNNHQHGDTSNEPILQCAQCAMTFTCEDTYEEHMFTHD